MATKSTDSDPSMLQPDTRLLSLPRELRTMIWKAVLDMPSYFLHTIPHHWKDKKEITTTQCSFIPSSHRNTSCLSLHREPAYPYRLPPLPGDRKPPRPRPRGALSWLRTCRLIHTEATPLLSTNFPSLHVCDWLTLRAALDHRTPTLPLSYIKSLTLCIPIPVVPDGKEDSFGPPFRNSRSDTEAATDDAYKNLVHRWRKSLTIHCDHCFPPTRPLPNLETLNLYVVFECSPFKGNKRRPEPSATSQKNRAKKGILHARPRRSAGRLKWTDDGERQTVKDMIEDLTYETTLEEFWDIATVNVEFDLVGVRHTPWNNRCPDIRDQCWCRGRGIDGGSVPVKQIRRYLMGCLMEGYDGGEGGEDG